MTFVDLFVKIRFGKILVLIDCVGLVEVICKVFIG